MEGLKATANNIISTLQLMGGVSAAVCFSVIGYLFFFGGREGRQIGKGWIFGIIAGLVLLIGAKSIAELITSNINF